jgi:H/ACA ribonucleoprotein complex subunit 1
LFSVKPAEGVKADSFKAGQKIYMDPQDLLNIDIFTRKRTPAHKGPRGVNRGGGKNDFFFLESIT